MTETYTPDIKIPRDDPPGLENLIRREWADLRYVRSLDREAMAKRDAGQCEVNIDALLDNYPLGVRRRELTEDEMVTAGYGKYFKRALARAAAKALERKAA